MQAHQRMLDPTANSLHSGESPLLKTVGLTKRYGDFLANDAIDIDIWPTEIHALLGENGAGKSTLVKAIYGLIQPSAGEIRWQGQPIDAVRPLGSAQPRHRHGVPALLAVRQSHRRRERRARPRRQGILQGHVGAA